MPETSISRSAELATKFGFSADSYPAAITPAQAMEMVRALEPTHHRIGYIALDPDHEILTDAPEAAETAENIRLHGHLRVSRGITTTDAILIEGFFHATEFPEPSRGIIIPSVLAMPHHLSRESGRDNSTWQPLIGNRFALWAARR